MNVLDLIGNTPLLSINDIYFKMEMMNPSGSIKDRIAKEMLMPYVKQGIKKLTVVEATSGNTGISIAMVCAALGWECWIICPHSTSPLKIRLMRQYGAKIDTAEDIAACIEKARKMILHGTANVYPDQFSNTYNIEAQTKMAEEARKQLTENYMHMYFGSTSYKWKNAEKLLPNAIVAGTGTGGTLMGLHKAFPKAAVYIVHTMGETPIEGITDAVPQPLIPKDMVRKDIYVTYNSALMTANMLMKMGISCGISSGANYYGAYIIRTIYDKVLTVFADNRMRYL